MRIPLEWLPVIRNFEDRGIQMLLEAPENVRGILCILAADLCERLDFSLMFSEPVSFIGRDLRKRETDLVLRIPYRHPAPGGPEQVWIYLLIEHQSEPDVEIRFRLLYGMAGLWNKQRREFDGYRLSREERRYIPIVPVVIYTGETSLDIAAPVTSLMDVPAELERFQPHFDVLTLDLQRMAPSTLTACDHPFAWLLRVIQEENSPLEQLTAAVVEATKRLTELENVDPAALQSALIFLILLLYHRRERAEADSLVQKIADVRPVENREETIAMGKTYAQELLEEGEARGEVRAKQDWLLMLLDRKFGPLPERVTQHVRSLEDTEALDVLAMRFVDASSLEAMGL